MRKLMLVMVGLVALATAGFAVANGLDGPRTAKGVAGTFSAAAVNTQTRTCQAANGDTIAVTRGRYSGQASGDPDLAGPIKVYAHSVVDSTTGFGVVHGKLRIDVASGGDTVAVFTAVYDHGKVAGLGTGHAHQPYARLLANLSAGFVPASGFTGGKLGGSDGGSAVELSPGRCEPTPSKPHEKSAAKGTISQLSAGSITVAGLSCVLPPELAAKVNSDFKVGDRAEIHCVLIGSTNTLVRIQKK
jgi:hypothetical protein